MAHRHRRRPGRGRDHRGHRTTEATARHHPRPGVAYRLLRDAPPVEVRLAWWADSPPPGLAGLVEVVRARLSGTAVPG
ncbi:hypothetical protein ACI798_09040 [Geodermatophilus sp. SYSU D01045]